MTDRRAGHPVVSVVIPCYNAESTIISCLESLYSQHFVSMEIVCVDDGSTDSTEIILNENQLQHPELVVVRQSNSGAWLARLAGIRAAAGDYIMFLDSDDTAAPGFIEKMYSCASALNSDLVVCGFNRINVDTGLVMSSEFCDARSSFSLKSEPGKLLQINPAPWNKIFKASLLHGVNELSVSPVMLDDLSLLLLALLQSDGDVFYLPEALVEYRVHQDSAINSINECQLKDAIAAMVEIRSCYETSKSSRMLEAFDSVAFVHVVVSMSFRILGSDSENKPHVIASLIEAADSEFPLWRTSRYLRIGYGCKHGGLFYKASLASALVKVGLLMPALRVYRLIRNALGKDISW